jgi:hypothetical protein
VGDVFTAQLLIATLLVTSTAHIIVQGWTGSQPIALMFGETLVLLVEGTVFFFVAEATLASLVVPVVVGFLSLWSFF